MNAGSIDDENVGDVTDGTGRHAVADNDVTATEGWWGGARNYK